MKTQVRVVTPPVTEDFARYEFKYLLSANMREEIESEVSHFMTYDGHVHEELGNCYFVRSLYFDNDSAVNYYEKIDGVGRRRKFRLRTYGQSLKEDVPVFLEEKGRKIERSYKHRVAIDAAHLEIFCNPARHLELLNLYPNVELVERFFFDSIRQSIKPKVVVDYIRRPYTSAFDTNFRLTFDGSLVACGVSELFPQQDRGWYQSLSGYTVLEVKFHRRIPAWFHSILQAYNMQRVSISKFCKGIEVCSIAQDLS